MRFVLRAALLTATILSPGAALAQAVADNSGDIIVTARKVSEKLQNAPTTVAVATAATIENLGLTSVADIAKTTPGLVLDNSFGRTGSDRPVIRGQANILGFSGVAYFIDGIYYSGSISDYDVNSIARIEVVKGPQSALYGRNTYSGAINIISKAPGDHWLGQIEANIGERNYYRVNGNVSGPLGSGFGVILGGSYFYNKGDFINKFDGSRIGKQATATGLGMLTYDNGGAIRASLRANYNKTDDGQPAIFATSTNDNNCFFDRGSYYNNDGRYFCGVIQPRQINSDYSRRFVDLSYAGSHIRTWNTALKIEADVADHVTLTSLTGYNSRVFDYQVDGDYTGLAFQQPIYYNYFCGPGTLCLGNNGAAVDFTNSTHEFTRDVSEEIRLRYDGERVKLLIGGYYFRQVDRNFDNRVLPASALAQAQAAFAIQAADICAHVAGCLRTVTTVPISIAAPDRNAQFLTTRNIAIFGSVDFKFTDTLSLNVEGRYAEERVDQATQTYNLGQMPPAPNLASATYRRFTPRIALDWQVTPNHLFYAIYAEGEKPGGFNGNLAIVAGFPTYDTERVRSYEIGTKNTFLNGALTANLAVFHNNIKGYQLSGTISVPPNQVSVTRNAGDATIDGAELSLIMRPDRHLTITANYALAHSRFTSGGDEVLGLLYDIADDGLNNCSTGKQYPTLACGSTNALYGSISGKTIPRSPEHTIFADIDYHRPIGGSGWSLFTGANVTVLSNSFDQVGNFARTGGSAVVDARLGIENGVFKVQGYVTNLTNENSVQQILRYAGPDFRRNFTAGLRPPRRIGLIVQAKF
jgi:iron complex outermembrane receptor protein